MPEHVHFGAQNGHHPQKHLPIICQNFAQKKCTDPRRSLSRNTIIPQSNCMQLPLSD